MITKFAKTEFDNDLLTVEEMRWRPWIGDKYSAGPRVLILGESHYNWGECEADRHSADARLNNRLFNRELIEVDHAMNRGSHQKFYRNIERMLFQAPCPNGADTDLLWRSVAYLNLVQRPMTDHRARPANDDLMKGWEACLKILPIIRPRLILVAGSDWRKVSTFKTTLSRHGGTIIMEACSEAISNAYGKHLLATTNDKSEFSLVFSMHPSGRNYSWKKWCPFVFKCAPELNAFVQKCRCAPAA